MLGNEAALFVPSGTQSNLCGDHEPLPARRRVHRRPDGAHLPLGRRRRGGARQRAAAAAGAPGRRHAGAGRHRGGDQARRRALRAQPAAVPGEHARRQGAAAGLPARRPPRWRSARGLATHLDGARLFNAAVGAGRRCARASARRSRSTSTACRSASSKGLGAPVGSALCGSQRVHRRARTAGARWSAAACARPACWPRRRCTRSITTSTAWPTTTRIARRLAEGLHGMPGVHGRAAADQHRVRRRRGRARRRRCWRT